jgi:hypothetical protein
MHQTPPASERRQHILHRLEEVCLAEQRGANPDECSGKRWECYMLLGRFEEAWIESDRIATRGYRDPNRFWNGEPFAGKRVIIRSLHGFGDAIQFIRFAPAIRRTAAHITVECHREILGIIANADGVDRAVTWGEAEGTWNVQVEMNELPRIFRVNIETIPRGIPYIRVPQEAVESSPLNGGKNGRPRVGVVWGSGPFNAARSIPLEQLLKPFENLDWEVYRLQHGSACAEASASSFQIACAREQDGNLLNTAADMMHLDLIVTVDTVTAHLAGALGRPVWTLLPFEADWRWMLDRADSPWYPTMRLFRQLHAGDWSAPLRQIRESAAGLSGLPDLH